jgi:hypothetical protein
LWGKAINVVCPGLLSDRHHDRGARCRRLRGIGRPRRIGWRRSSRGGIPPPQAARTKERTTSSERTLQSQFERLPDRNTCCLNETTPSTTGEAPSRSPLPYCQWLPLPHLLLEKHAIRQERKATWSSVMEHVDT